MKKRWIRKLFKCFLSCVALVLCATLLLNLIVCLSVKSKMRTLEDSLSEGGYDCIIVLGCGVWGDTPTTLLSDRLDAAIALYRAEVAPKILMSGDHGRTDYDEVNVMRQYALDRGVYPRRTSLWIMRAFPPMRPCTGRRTFSASAGRSW